MTLPDQRWRPVGPSASDHEQAALDAIRELLPDDPRCHAWTNISVIDTRGLPMEIDLLLLTRAGLFVVELKGWHGEISGKMYDWTVKNHKGSQQLSSPVKLTDLKAKRIRSLLHELREEHHERVQIPFVAPVVVLHGKGSVAKLDGRAKARVYGLDAFGVKGLPTFTNFLHEGPLHGPELDGPAVQALARLVSRSGMAPRVAEPVEPVAEQDVVELVGVAETAHKADVEALPPLAEVTDDDLLALKVPPDALDTVRSVPRELEDLIGLVPDDVFDDLEAFLDGTPVQEIVDRRTRAETILRDVDAQAQVVGAEPAAAADTAAFPEPVTDAAASTEVPSALEPPVKDEPAISSAEVERLRSVFGDKVRAARRRPAREPTLRPPPAAVLPARSVSAVPEMPPASTPPEELLSIARYEALAGRVPSARALLEAVERRMERVGDADWSVEDIADLLGRLWPHVLLRQRLETLVDDARARVPAAPAIGEGVAPPTGQLWSEGGVGPAYSLLLRVSDVLDRTNGVYLSQVVGPEKAATVNARLLQGRPDGGRIRITPTGVVVSRRDASSPFFVVGQVSADEWFPAAASTESVSPALMVAAAP